MSGRSLPLAVSLAPGCLTFSPADSALWLGATAGEIVAFRLLDNRSRALGGGYQSPVAVLPLPNGLGVLVAEAAGRLLVANRSAAAAAQAATLVDLGRQIVAAHLHPDDASVLVLESGPAARLLRIDLQTGAEQSLAQDLSNPSLLAVSAVDNLAVVVEQGDAGPAFVTVDMATGALDRPAVAVPAGLTALCAAPGGAGGVLAAAGATGELSLINLAGAAAVPGPAVGAEVQGIGCWGSLVLAITGAGALALEWGIDDGPVPLRVPLAPAFVSGWLPVEIDVSAGGLAANDVDLVVAEGDNAGTVSLGVEPLGPAGERRLRLLAGQTPGEYHLFVVRKADGERVGQARFRVISHWPDDIVGPPIAITGQRQDLQGGFGGGGPAGPQNVRIHPAPEVWRVAIVLMSTKDRRWGGSNSIGAAKTQWDDTMQGGGQSVRRFYEEVSFRNTPGAAGAPLGTTMTLVDNRVFGPVDLEHGWGDYFDPFKKGMPWLGWLPKDTTYQDCITAFCNFLQDRGLAQQVISQTDAMVFIIRTASDDEIKVGKDVLPAQFAWPIAGGRVNPYNAFWKTEFATTVKPMRCLFMPSEFPFLMPADKRFDLPPVLSHELAHTLGCEDLYNKGSFTAEVEARQIGKLDLMDDDYQWPGFSLPNRMRLGWIAPQWVQPFDFGKNPSGGTVTLQALETLSRSGPPPGRKAGIEIRLRDGVNYYFEYRREQGGQIGDQQLNLVEASQNMVVGTDVIADGISDPGRPRILLLPKDADGEGPTLNAANEDYEETDTTSPHDFRLIFQQLVPGDDNAAQVRVEYVRANRPELQISPAPGNGDWKSPDIDVEGPGGANRVQKGQRHTVVMRVKNAGTVAAENVRVSAKWLPFTTAPGSWNNLPEMPRQNIAPNTTATYRVDWEVPADLKLNNVDVDHFCVRVEIDRFVDARDDTHSEIVVFNNWAQSNFDSTNVSHGSPSDRRSTGIAVTNVLAQEATYLTVMEQTSQHYRAYLGHAWLKLQPGETAMLPVSYESLAGDPVHGADFPNIDQMQHEPPNKLSFTTLVRPLDHSRCPAPHVVWGAGLSIRAGFRTWFRDVDMPGEIVRGHIVAEINGLEQAVSGGQVNVVLWLAERPEELFRASGNVDVNGRFFAVVPQELMHHFGHAEIVGEVFYLGTGMFSPARSGIQRLA